MVFSCLYLFNLPHEIQSDETGRRDSENPGIDSKTMSDVIEINNDLIAIEARIRELETDYMASAKKYAENRVIYKLKFAEQMLKAEGAAHLRTAIALKICATEYRNYRITEQIAISTKEALRATQSRLTSIQTRSGLLKTDLSLDNYRT